MSLPPELTLEQRLERLGLKTVQQWEAELEEQSSWSDFLDTNFTAGIGWMISSFIGFQQGGPAIGALTAITGLVSQYWSREALRDQRIVYYLNMGIEIQRRPTAIRSVLYTTRGLQFSGQHSELVAEVLVETLKKYRPDLSVRQLRVIGSRAMMIFSEFVKKYPGLPVEVAADSVLALYRVLPLADEEGKDYVFAPAQTPGAPAVTPGETPPGEEEEEKKRNVYIYAAIGLIAVLLVSQRD